MDRRTFLKTTVASLPLFTQANPLFANQEKPVNFVFILVDDLGWKDLACYGSTFYETPNLDRFAKTAIRFTDAYAACPVCSPTRAAIMTGKYPTRLNITDWIPGRDDQDKRMLGPQDLHQLPHEEETIAEVLQQNHYKTFFAGKWHLGGEGYYPEDQGFEINIGGHEKGSPPGGYFSPYKNPKLEDGPEGEYLPDRLTNESLQYLETNHENPFLLFLSYYTVHTPIQACPRHLEYFKEKAANLPETDKPAQLPEHDGNTKQRQDNPEYASMIYAMDENVGKILDKLDELDIADNTVVIFTSDNGGLSTLPRNGFPTSNLPLRAGKGWCYEGGIRVPLLIRTPQFKHGGKVCSTPVISNDFYPTMLELANLPLQPSQHEDGLSLVPLLNDGTIQRKNLYWHYPHYHGSAWTPGAAIRSGDWKLIEFYDFEKVELYHLKNDISEQHELSEQHPEKTTELLTLLHKWQKNTDAKPTTINPNYQKG